MRSCLLALMLAGISMLPAVVSPAQPPTESLPLPSSAHAQRQDVGRLMDAIGLVWGAPARGEGVVVERVGGGGPASAAGLRAGDTIRVANGKAIRSLADWVAALVPGQRVALQYERAGRLWTTVLSVPDVPLNAQQPMPRARVRPTLGVTVRTVGNRERLELGIPQDINGLLVTQVQPGSPAARDGLPLGSVILQVDNVLMREPDDLIAVVRSARLGQPLEIRYWHRGRIGRKRIAVVPEIMVPQSVLELEKQLEEPDAPAPPVANELPLLRARIETLERELAAVKARLKALEDRLRKSEATDLRQDASSPEGGQPSPLPRSSIKSSTSGQ